VTTPQPIESAYPSVMEYISQRISAAENAIDEVVCNPGHQNSWISCELATIQIRMICELIMLGSVLAHIQSGEELDDRKWRPKEAFGELDRVNSHPLPIPVELIYDANGPGAHQANPVSKPLPLNAISKIYGICGDLLHIPTARRVMEAKRPSYDLDQLQRWLTGLKRIIVGHALMLPERRRVLLCTWSGLAGEVPKCVLLDAMGESTFDLSKLAEFDLLP